MPEGVGYGPQDTASAGLNLNVIGNHAYGYSGVLDIDNAETNMLLFRTGNFYFVGTIQFNYAERNGEAFMYRFYLNGSIVQAFADSGGSNSEPQPTNFINIIIPPYTQVKATAQNIVDTASRDQVCSMAGRIYGKID